MNDWAESCMDCLWEWKKRSLEDYVVLNAYMILYINIYQLHTVVHLCIVSIDSPIQTGQWSTFVFNWIV